MKNFEQHNCCFSRVWSQVCPSPGWVTNGHNSASGDWADLNDGAGGYYIYLQSCMTSANSFAITDIAIISSSSSMSSYPGWSFVNLDLNKGAGGKWIYLCFKGVYN